MELDERAFVAAWDAFVASYGKDRNIQLRDSIIAYEQAREGVAVPSREEIAAGLSTAYQASELNADEALEFDDIPEDERKRHLWMADYVLTLLRPAPSAQPWTREPCQKFFVSSAPVPADAERPCQPGVVHFGPISPVASAQESVIVNGVSMPYAKAMRRVHESHREVCLRYAEQIRNLEKRAKRAEDQAGRARCERDDAEAIRNLAVEREQEAEKRAESLERDLAAERDAHRLTADAKRVAMERAAELERERDAMQHAMSEKDQELERLRFNMAGKSEAYENADVMTGEAARFWQSVDGACKEVASWPAWKRGVSEAPEPAKPATPDLDLAGRVVRVEKALRELCRFGGGMSLLECMGDAIKALEGGGSNG